MPPKQTAAVTASPSAVDGLTIEQLEAALNEKRAERLQPMKEKVEDLWEDLRAAVVEVRKSEPKFPAPWQAWLTKERAETAIKAFLKENPDSTTGQIVKGLEGKHVEAKIVKALTTRSTGERPWFVQDATTKGYSLKVK
jgi:iron uptake system EfeUOB component EfeO/EfeM